MGFYHSWIYENILNNQWVIWAIVIVVLAFNILSPIFIWFLMSGRKFFRKNKKDTQEKSG